VGAQDKRKALGGRERSPEREALREREREPWGRGEVSGKWADLGKSGNPEAASRSPHPDGES
jgi:hypothetical protein